MAANDSKVENAGAWLRELDFSKRDVEGLIKSCCIIYDFGEVPKSKDLGPHVIQRAQILKREKKRKSFAQIADIFRFYENTKD